MDHRQICAAGGVTDRDRLLGIALVLVGMGFYAAESLLLHGDRRQDQRIGSTENDDACHHTQYITPNPLLLTATAILLCSCISCFLHHHSPLLSI